MFYGNFLINEVKHLSNDGYCVIIGIVGGMISKLVGGFDYSIKAMFLLMIVDIISGFVCAAFFNKSKYSSNGVTSDALIKGAIRKISILSIVAIGVVVDRVLEIDIIRNGVVIYFIATEGISVLEHMVIIGIPIPQFVLSILENMKKETENIGNEKINSDKK